MSVLGAFVIALIIAILFSPYKRQDSVMPLVILFMILFAAGMAAQYWIVPFGPVIWGVAWFRILFIVLIFALLFSAPPPYRRTRAGDDNEAEPVITAMSIFVWVILFLLLLAIVLGLYYSETLLVSKMYYNRHLMSFL